MNKVGYTVHNFGIWTLLTCSTAQCYNTHWKQSPSLLLTSLFIDLQPFHPTLCSPISLLFYISLSCSLLPFPCLSSSFLLSSSPPLSLSICSSLYRVVLWSKQIKICGQYTYFETRKDWRAWHDQPIRSDRVNPTFRLGEPKAEVMCCSEPRYSKAATQSPAPLSPPSRAAASRLPPVSRLLRHAGGYSVTILTENPQRPLNKICEWD